MIKLARKIIRKIRYYIALLLGNEICYKRDIQLSKIYVGSDYGGFYISSNTLPKNPIVYSFGIGTDISFDKEMIQKFNATVYAFDPTPKSVARVSSQNLPNGFVFEAVGISDKDGTEDRYLPENESFVSCTSIEENTGFSKHKETVKVKQLLSFMAEFGHKHIDVLKMDIEGAEYKVIENILQQNISINQLLVEFHHRFSNISPNKTKQTIKLLKSKGYKLFAVSDSYQELSFIKEA